MTHTKKHRIYNAHYALIQFCYWSLLSAYYAFGATYLYSLGLSSSMTGLILAATGLLSSLLQPMLARLADRSGAVTTKGLSVCLAIPACLLLFFVYLPLGSWLLDVILYALAWMLLVTLGFLISAFGMEYVAAGIPLNFGMGRAGGSFGYALFAYILGIQAARLSAAVTLPFAAFFSALLCASLLFWKDLPVEKAAQESAREAKKAAFFARYPRFALFSAGCLLLMIPYCMCNSFFVRIVNNLGGGSAQLGTATLIMALTEVPTLFLSLRLRDRFGSGKLMMFTAVTLSLKSLFLLLVPSIGWLYAAMLSQLISYSLFIPVSVYYADARMGMGDKAQGQAVVALIPTLGNAAGSLLGGVILDAFGVPGMLLSCFICSCIGTAVTIAGTEKVH